MGTIIAILFTAWIVSAFCERNRRKKIEELKREEQIKSDAKIAAYREWKAAQAKATEEWNKARQFAIEEQTRLIALEEEQRRQAEEQARMRGQIEAHQEWLKRHDEEIGKLQARIGRAEKEIDHIMVQMEQKREYGEYLELERDACVKGSKFYHGWNNKVIANTNQLHNMEMKLDKAIENREIALAQLNETVKEVA